MHVPAPDLADTDDDEAAPDPGDTDDEDDRDTRAATTSQEWLELEKHARNRTVAACDQGQCTPALPMCTTQIITP
jgi:hypothetical protein